MGQYGELTVDQARTMAQEWLADVRKDALQQRADFLEEQRLGQQLAATVRGGGVSWELGRHRGPTI